MEITIHPVRNSLKLQLFMIELLDNEFRHDVFITLSCILCEIQTGYIWVTKNVLEILEF